MEHEKMKAQIKEMATDIKLTFEKAELIGAICPSPNMIATDLCNKGYSKQNKDTVEVVRCKNCIYYKANCCFNRQWDFETSTEIPLVRENDYCSYGELKIKGGAE